MWSQDSNPALMLFHEWTAEAVTAAPKAGKQNIAHKQTKTNLKHQHKNQRCSIFKLLTKWSQSLYQNNKKHL